MTAARDEAMRTRKAACDAAVAAGGIGVWLCIYPLERAGTDDVSALLREACALVGTALVASVLRHRAPARVGLWFVVALARVVMLGATFSAKKLGALGPGLLLASCGQALVLAVAPFLRGEDEEPGAASRRV
jgi:peptidoglycan/LPS O-acetylase OafA/YrhL